MDSKNLVRGEAWIRLHKDYEALWYNDSYYADTPTFVKIKDEVFNITIK